MATATSVATWHRLAFSIKGMSHLGAGLPMQDAMRSWPKGNRPASVAIIAVCDGHGNRKHFRSATGSRIAAELATRIGQRYANKLKGSALTGNMAAAVSKKISEELQSTWVQRVTQHAVCEPFEQRRLSPLNKKELKLLRVAPQVAYGATCLTAVITQHWGLLLRIGDGVIAVCDEVGDVFLPFSEEEKSSQVTASLCSPNAADLVESHFLDFSTDRTPASIVLATDGYPDACGGVKRFVERAAVFAEKLRSKSTEDFASWFRSHLDQSSEHLFDDSTVAFLARSDWSSSGGGS